MCSQAPRDNATQTATANRRASKLRRALDALEWQRPTANARTNAPFVSRKICARRRYQVMNEDDYSTATVPRRGSKNGPIENTELPPPSAAN
jgi:hypothetical protein